MDIGYIINAHPLSEIKCLRSPCSDIYALVKIKWWWPQICFVFFFTIYMAQPVHCSSWQTIPFLCGGWIVALPPAPRPKTFVICEGWIELNLTITSCLHVTLTFVISICFHL